VISIGINAERRSRLRLFSYVVARDYGFAPNPFFGVCTLATCKPIIRRVAAVGDWVIGTGTSKRNRDGFLVFAMRITCTMSFNEYWNNERFRRKKPNLRGSKKQAFGDNIYFKNGPEDWHQQDSHHSYQDGNPNPFNISNDTQTDRILLSSDFTYWGGSGPTLPEIIRNYNGCDICAGRGHKSRFPAPLVDQFIAWFRSLGVTGYAGAPLDWPRTP